MGEWEAGRQWCDGVYSETEKDDCVSTKRRLYVCAACNAVLRCEIYCIVIITVFYKTVVGRRVLYHVRICLINPIHVLLQ